MISKRVVFLAAAAVAANLLVGTGAAVGVADPCLVEPPQTTPGAWVIDGVSGITGGTGDDQIVGTAAAEVLYGMAGDDVILGNGGNDTICGGAGRDGVNGGEGDDTIGGGADEDFLHGMDGGDAIWGGAARDGIYGGYGADTITSNDDGTTADYLVGGPDVDSISASGDSDHQDMGPTTSCPSDAGKWQGTYGLHFRLPIRVPTNACRTFTGTVFDARNTGDGDRHFNLKNSSGNVIQVDNPLAADGKSDLVFELMPRDQRELENLPNGSSVTITGLFSTDNWHNDKPEIHPIYQVTFNGTTYNLGPRLGGSPFRIKPEGTLYGTTTRLRFCWNELGRPCRPYDGSTQEFSIPDMLMDATQVLADPADRTYS